MAELTSLWSHVSGTARVAARGFVETLLLFLALGAVLAGVSCWWLGEDHLWIVRAAIAAAVLLEGIVIGVVLGAKRALGMAAVHAMRASHVGRLATSAVFEGLLNTARPLGSGDPGGTVARAAERVPLAQAEQCLAAAVQNLLRARSGNGGVGQWFRRRLEALLLGWVGKYTLADMRSADARHGGVDLAAVRARLETEIDDRLAAKLRHGVNFWTAAAVLLFPLQVLATIYLLLAWTR